MQKKFIAEATYLALLVFAILYIVFMYVWLPDEPIYHECHRYEKPYV